MPPDDLRQGEKGETPLQMRHTSTHHAQLRTRTIPRFGGQVQRDKGGEAGRRRVAARRHVLLRIALGALGRALGRCSARRRVRHAHDQVSHDDAACAIIFARAISVICVVSAK